MALTKNAVLDLWVTVWGRSNALILLAAEMLEIEDVHPEIPDTWNEPFRAALEELYPATDAEDPPERLLQALATLACVQECVEWMGDFIRRDAPSIADMNSPFADLLKLDEGCRDLVRSRDPEIQSALFELKPFKLTKGRIDLWFARQDVRLSNSKLPWVRIRGLRGEVPGDDGTSYEISKRATALKRRTLAREAEFLLTDCYLDEKVLEVLELCNLRELQEVGVTANRLGESIFFVG